MLKPLTIILLLSAASVAAQESKKSKNLKIMPVPAFGYSPETKTYVGAVTLITYRHMHDTSARTSNYKLEINYTWNKRMIIETGWNSFLKGEKWFTKGLLHYYRYPD